MLHLPQINRALWLSVRLQAHTAATAVTSHHFALAAASVMGAMLVGLSIAGSLFITTGLIRRLAAAGLRWSAGRTGTPGPGRRGRAGCAGRARDAGAAQGAFTGW